MVSQLLQFCQQHHQDSGCYNHMTSNAHNLINKADARSISAIHTVDGSKMNITHTSDIFDPNLSISDAFLIPKLALNLISMGQLCELGLGVYFSHHGCLVQDPHSGQVLGKGREVGRLFEAISLNIPANGFRHSSIAATVLYSDILHSRLGHICLSKLQPLITSGVLGQVRQNKVDCISCKLAKHHALPFNNNNSISNAPFDLIHSDI